MQSLVYFLVFLINIFYTLGNTHPQLVCGVRDTACLIVETYDILNAIIGGFEPLNTERLDPMFIDFINIDQDDYRINLRRTYVSGLKDLAIQDVRTDLSSKEFRILFNTNFEFRSLYLANGSLLSTHIEGEGNFFMKFHNCRIDLSMPFDIIEDAHGNDVMMLNSFQYTYDVRDGAQFYFDNLYFGNKTASNALHNLLQQNWKKMSEGFGESAIDLINMKIFNALQIYMRSRSLKEYIKY